MTALVSVTVIRRGAVIHVSGILGIRILVDRSSGVLFWKEFFDFPVVGFDTDGELEIFFGDIIPELHAIRLASKSL